MRPAFLLSLALALPAKDVIPLAPEDSAARLHVNIVDQFGQPVSPAHASFTLYRVSGNPLLPNAAAIPWRNGERLPAGSYTLKLSVSGFRTGYHSFAIADQPLALTLAALFAPTGRESTSLEIKLREPSPGRSRVRILPAHQPAHPVALRTELLHNGSVTFTQIHTGDYIAVLLDDKGGVCRAAPVRVSLAGAATSL
jgi:hypothetical protein